MGKALLIIVLGGGIVLGRQMFSNQATEMESRQDQVDYEEEVLAREIARSAFNVAMGTAREAPSAIDAAVAAIHSADGTADSVYVGEARGGHFHVRAATETGHSLRVTATGYFGGYFNDDGEYVKRNRYGREVPGAMYTMSDQYRIRVLEVQEDGELDVEFLSSEAGFCSSVFMQEFRNGELISSRMIYASGRNRDGSSTESHYYVQAGTQLGFFIGVDEDCSEQPSSPTTCELRTALMDYDYNPAQYAGDGSQVTTGVGDWDYVHHSLNVPQGAIDRTTESIWAMVEQHPTDRQHWRIAWEDVHNGAWNNPNSPNPASSLYALKREGYDRDGDNRGDGWSERSARGFRALEEATLDLNDQVIEVFVRPLATTADREALRATMLAEREACGITNTFGLPPTTAVTELPPPPTDTEPTDEPTEPGPEPTAGCACPRGPALSHKVAVMHRPPGNEANEHVICVALPGAQTHLRQHNDYVICEGE
jgi:hypothetical protein